MNNISVRKSFYPSYCYYLLKQTGLLPTNKEQTLLNEGRKLSEIGSEFSFNGPVAGGPIFTFIYQIPSYLDIDKTEIHDVFEALISFIESKRLSFFMNKWPQKTHYWDLWYTKPWKEYLLNDVADNSKKALKVIEYFFKLVDKNWDLYKPIYNEKISEYDFIQANKTVSKLNAIKEWEKELDIEYPYDKFDIIICPESKSTASSLGPEKIVLGSMHNQEQLNNSYIHEVGVRTIGLHRLENNSLTKAFFSNDYIGMLKLIETEIAYRKKKLLPSLKDDIFIKSMNLEELVNWRNDQKSSSDVINDFSKFYNNAKENNLI